MTIPDRVHLDFAPSVSEDLRECILDAIGGVVLANGLHWYRSWEKETSGIFVEITANDRSKCLELTDGQVLSRLRIIAAGSNTTINALLRKAAGL